MNRFLKRLLLVFLFCYGILFLLQIFIDFKIKNTDSGTYKEWNLLLNGKINTPMIFLGNSRTEVHFDTEIIKEKTGIQSYNLGYSGSCLAVDQIRWKSYLAHNKPPKIVVQNIDLSALTNKAIVDKYQYLPYYDDPTLFEELRKIDHNALYEKYIPMSKYRGYIDKLYEELVSKKHSRKTTTKIRGYVPHHSKWNSDFSKMKKELGGKKPIYSADGIESQLKVLSKTIADCERIDATLILVWSPQYFELNAFQEPTLTRMKKKIRQIALKNKNVLFWDFTTMELNRDKTYFYNSFHMNNIGVALFCKQFSDSLNVNVKKSIP